MTAAALVLVARTAWGVVLLAEPHRVLEHTRPGRPDTPVAADVLRVLGARHVVQAVAQTLQPAPTALYLGAVVDGLHGLSGLAFAALNRRWRRAALIDSAIAAGFALATALIASRDRAGVS
jgi:hypothetical protein